MSILGRNGRGVNRGVMSIQNKWYMLSAVLSHSVCQHMLSGTEEVID